MKKNILKTFCILISGLLIFPACDFNNSKERIVFVQESHTEPKTEPETVPESESEPAPETVIPPVTESEPQAETEPETETENESEPEAGPETEVEQESGSEQNPESEQEAAPESESEKEPESEPESEPETVVVPEPMPEIEVKKLVLLVYMAADNDLESYAIQNLKQMEHASFDKTDVLVLLDRADGYDETNGNWSDTRLFKVGHDDTNSSLIVSTRLSCPELGLAAGCETELDMGNFNVLRNFISYAKSEYEAEKYALIIWGHGTGWKYSSIENSGRNNSARAVAIDDHSNSYMSVTDLKRAVKGQGLSVIGFDTCFGGVIENIYELRNYAQYTVASPGITPSGGWDYKNLLEDISAGDFSTNAVSRAMAESSPTRITIFNNSYISSLASAIEDFSENLASAINNQSSRQSVFNSLFNLESYSYSQYPCDMYLDIASMADFYIDGTNAPSNNTAIKASAKRLKKAVNNAAYTENSENGKVGIHFIPLAGPRTAASIHSNDYIKDMDNTMQCSFIKENQHWVPSRNGSSGSLLDKLFYTDF